MKVLHLFSRETKLHSYRVDLLIEKFYRLRGSILQLVRVDAEPQAVKKIHCDLGVLDGLLPAIVSINHTSDSSAAEVLLCGGGT